jgi:O-methyltransferase
MLSVNDPVETVDYLQSVIPSNRLAYLARICRQTLTRVPGNILEVGVYKGGSLVALAQEAKLVDPELKVWGVDTFTGHPYSDGHPVHQIGKYKDVDLATLRRALTDTGCGDLHLVQQRIEEGIPNYITDLSFVHVDCDLYLPILFSALSLPFHMKPGGVIFFDDFGHGHCPGATAAVLEAVNRDPYSRLFENACWGVYMKEDQTMWSCYFQIGEISRGVERDGGSRNQSAQSGAEIGVGLALRGDRREEPA